MPHRLCMQVKIDGVRMEIDEIEAVLAAAPGERLSLLYLRQHES